MYNEVEVKAILIAVHNIENVGLNSKKVLLLIISSGLDASMRLRRMNLF